MAGLWRAVIEANVAAIKGQKGWERKERQYFMVDLMKHLAFMLTKMENHRKF